jgi:hypothetical protein
MLTGNPWLELILKAILWGCASYLAVYLAQKARHRAMLEDLKQFLARTQGEAEAKKRGETEAVQKDLQLILEQLRQTTALTKQVESEIAHEAWDRQMRVNLKRDLYVRLLEIMAEKVRTLRNLARLETILKDQAFEPERRNGRVTQHRELCDRNEDLNGKFQAAVAVACVSLPLDTTAVLDRLSKLIDEESSRPAAPVEYMLTEAALHKEAFDRLAVFAKRDIGDKNAGLRVK